MDKFKDQEALQKAYKSLEKEFTRRSQQLRELQGKIKQGTLKEIPENAVVLTKEEYDGKVIVVEMSGGHKLKLSVGKFYEMSKILEEYTRKETAEKFAERLKNEVLNFCGTVEENGYFERGKRCFCDDIDEICKEITESK